MKIPAVSGDLVIKLALVAGAVGLAWYAYRQAAGRIASAAGLVGGAVDSIVDTAAEVADSVIVGVNPANPSNWVNRGVTAVGSSIVSDTGPGRNADGSWSLGGAIFDLLNPGWSANLSGPTPEPIGLQLWGREARTPRPVFDGTTEEETPIAWDQLGNLGAP